MIKCTHNMCLSGCIVAITINIYSGYYDFNFRWVGKREIHVHGLYKLYDREFNLFHVSSRHAWCEMFSN